MKATARHLLALTVLLLLTLVVACGDDDKPEDTCCAPQVPTPSLPVSTTSAAAPTPSPAPSVNPTPTQEQTILIAAYGALSAQPLASCPTAGPPVVCAGAVTQPLMGTFGPKGSLPYARPPIDLSKGMTVLNLKNSAGATGVAIMGRNGAGQWQLFYTAPKNPMTPVQLPADGFACSPAAGVTHAIRAQANATSPQVGGVRHEEKMRVEEFVLVQPGTATRPGEGYFRVSSPVAGWIDAYLVADALWGECRFAYDNNQGPQGPFR